MTNTIYHVVRLGFIYYEIQYFLASSKLYVAACFMKVFFGKFQVPMPTLSDQLLLDTAAAVLNQYFLNIFPCQLPLKISFRIFPLS